MQRDIFFQIKYKQLKGQLVPIMSYLVDSNLRYVLLNAKVCTPSPMKKMLMEGSQYKEAGSIKEESHLSIRSSYGDTIYHSYTSIIREYNIPYFPTPTCIKDLCLI